jgi:hypothetical protein
MTARHQRFTIIEFIVHAKERRLYPRFEIDAEVIVRTASEFIPGRALEVSEYGMSAILPVELKEGEEAELKIRLPFTTVTIRGVVANRNVFRYGFRFLEALPELAKSTILPQL